MDMEPETPKKLVVLATHGDGEPPKTIVARYVKNIMQYVDNPKKTPFNYMMGVTLDQRVRDYHLTHKGKLLWDQIHMLKWYALNLCLRYDYTCCSRMNAPHLPFSCKLNLCLKILKILMIQFIDLNFLLSLNIDMLIINTITILLYLLIITPLSKKRLTFCRNLWKKKLMTL